MTNAIEYGAFTIMLTFTGTQERLIKKFTKLRRKNCGN